jgi:hypothetical protein
MAEFYLDPDKFKSQIDKYTSDASSINELKYTLEEDGIILKSIDKYLECITEFNNTIQLFNTMMEKDISSMKTIRANWLKLDKDMADITLRYLIFGKTGDK